MEQYHTEEGSDKFQSAIAMCLDEMVRLKAENKERKKQIETLVQTQNKLLTVIMGDSNVDNLKYEWNDPRIDKSSFYYPNFYKIEETVKWLAEERKSIARFGDGEFALMAGKERCRFQEYNRRLAERLKKIIFSKEDGFLIGIPDQYGSLEIYNKEGKYGIRPYMTAETRKEHRQFLDLNRTYHNAFISRPYAIYADNKTDAPRQRFQNLKCIWEGRNIIFVEGVLTRLGVGNDLFANAASIRRIEAPPVNAWDCYEELLVAAQQFAEPDSLFLIALGPSAGVLAYDLYHAGFQALDIGHVDLEYEWFLQGTGGRCSVPHKYNNELTGGDQVVDIYDETYLRQIIYVAGQNEK